MERKIKSFQISLLCLICLLPLLWSTACSRTEVNPDTSTETTSCLGCGGITGFGLNSPCWATEVQSVIINGSDDENKVTYGKITYYNDFGCIKDSEVKSRGVYADKVHFLGCALDCGSEKYTEYDEDEKVAYLESTCLGCETKKRKPVQVRGYNEAFERLYPYGCYSE